MNFIFYLFHFMLIKRILNFLFKWKALHNEKMDRRENEHQNVRVSANPVPDATPETCSLELFGGQCHDIAMTPSVKVSNGLMVH